MSTSHNGDTSKAKSSAVNRRNVLLVSSALVAASVLESTDGVDAAHAQAPATQPAISEQEARAIAADAYLYFYPLILMDITRKQSTNIEPGKEAFKGPMNMFVNVPTYPAADLRLVVRPNFDTLYSAAWLDMTGEPMIVSAPDTGGRYYLLPMIDMWTDMFASPGHSTGRTNIRSTSTRPTCRR